MASDGIKKTTPSESVTPHFYNLHNSDADSEKNDENTSEKIMSGADKIKNNLRKVERSAVSLASGGVNGEFTAKPGSSGGIDNRKKSLGKRILKTMTVPFLILGIIVFLIAAVVFSVPVVMMGSLDYKIQENTHWARTSAVLDAQAAPILGNEMAKGKIRSDVAAALDKYGITFGQIAANGEFVKTDTFIADLGVPKEIASLDVVYGDEDLDISLGKQEDGQLVVKFGNEIIDSSNFVSKLDSDPKMLYAYKTALNIVARYYYSDEVVDLYRTYGLNRNSFVSWEKTGNKEVDDAKFKELLSRALNGGDMVGLNGLDYDWYELCGKEQGTDEDCKRIVNSESECEWDECIPVYSDQCDESQLENCRVLRYEDIFKNKSLRTGVSELGDTDAMINIASDVIINEDNAMANKRYASLLNQAVNSELPWKSAKFFVAFMEALNKARIVGTGESGEQVDKTMDEVRVFGATNHTSPFGGFLDEARIVGGTSSRAPVNEFLNLLSKKGPAEITNVYTGETEITNKSLLGTQNFLATVSDAAKYSLDEAASYSRDAVTNIANNVANYGVDDESINKTVSTSVGSNRFNLLITMRHEDPANSLTQASNPVKNVFYNDPVDEITSTTGGNMIPSGGLFWCNMINQNIIGAVPSNDDENTKYEEQAQAFLTKEKNAEREVLSPFDISSPNTFLGGIVSDFGSTLLKNYGMGGEENGNITTTISSIADYAGKSVSSITSGAYAEDGETLAMMNGDCSTVRSIGTAGDIWCNSKQPIVTDYIYRTEDEWGDMINDEDYQRFLIIGSGREASVGIQSADACKRWKEFEAQNNIIKKGFLAISDYFSDYKDLYEECEPGGFWERMIIGEVPEDVATGKSYTIGAQNEDDEKIKEYAGYTLFQMVKSLVTDDENEVTAFKERYYAEHPLDNSPAGIISRRSGMSKKDAQLALNYASYLNVIAKYDASTRMAFGKVKLDIEEKIPIEIKDSQDYNNTLALIVASKNGQIVRRQDNTTA